MGERCRAGIEPVNPPLQRLGCAHEWCNGPPCQPVVVGHGRRDVNADGDRLGTDSGKHVHGMTQ